MSETKDFADIVVPVLEAGTWTNAGFTPKIVTKNKAAPNKKSARHSKNARVEVRIQPSPATELTFNGTIISQTLRGTIKAVHTDNSKRNLMKTDIPLILKASNIPFLISGIDETEKKRNKETADYSVEIISC